MGVWRKTKRRVETILAWVFAFIIIALIAAGVIFVMEGL